LRKSKASSAIVLFLVVFAFALVGGSPEQSVPACSDGLDNDGDGQIDGFDNECKYTFPVDPTSQDPPTSIYCPNWDDEANPPQTEQECV
jgi:hypothetical protein